MSDTAAHRRSTAATAPASPGPWNAQPKQSDHGDTTVIVAADGFVVASIPSRAWDEKARLRDPQDRANAKLLAQAHQMGAIVRAIAGCPQAAPWLSRLTMPDGSSVWDALGACAREIQP